MKKVLFFVLIGLFIDSYSQGVNEQKVVITNEGWELVGILNIPKTKQKPPIVIFGHTLWSGEKSQYDKIAQLLSINGIASLRVDLRGHGESTNKGKLSRLDTNPVYLFDAWSDIVAAYKYVENLSAIDASKIGILASSYSGELVAKAGRNYKYAKAYVILSSALFSQESTLRIPYSKADWWHIVAKDDPTFATKAVSYVKKRSTSRVSILETGGHGPELLENHENLAQQIVNWFQTKLNKKDIVLNEKDVIPEGTAYHEKTNTVYIGSIYKQKIIAILPDGSTKDVIEKDVFGNMSPIGIVIDENTNTLWVNAATAPIVNQSKSVEWKTTVMAFDLKDHSLINKYESLDTKQGFLNDITVSDQGTIYATETVAGKIYSIDKKRNKLEELITLDGFSFPNGITFYAPTNTLFVATNEGIVSVDLKTRKVTLLETKKGINAKVIDGLAIYDNYFIGHQSSRVSKFYFNESMTKITSSEILDTGYEFDSSTTGEIGNGYYHFIVNSQIRSGVNQKEKSIKHQDSLEPVIIRKLKLLKK